MGGQRDPRQLAQLRDPRIKADEATIAKSLQGHWREEHIFELTQALELYRFYQDKIAECDREIEAQLERFEDHSNGDPPAAKPSWSVSRITAMVILQRRSPVGAFRGSQQW